MKKILLSILLLLLVSFAFSQKHRTDSIALLLKNLPANERRLDMLWQLSKPSNNKPVVAMIYAQQGLELAKKLHLAKQQEDFIYALGVAYYLNHDYPKSIEMAFLGLDLSKEINDINYSSTFLYGMSVCYADAGDLKSAITYSQKDVQLLITTHIHAKFGNKETIATLYGNIARYYMKLNLPDSALIYMQKSYSLGTAINYSLIGNTLVGLGMIEEKMNHTDLALSYYRLAIVKCKSNPGANLVQANLSIAALYKKMNHPDSALFYGNEAYRLAKAEGDVDDIYKTAQLLSNLYTGNNELQSLRYYKIAAIYKDSLNITEKAKEFQIITSRERQRELEAEEQRLKEKEERKENLQWIGLAVFIPAFILLVLQLSKTRIHRRLIDFMGVLSLLLLFEFITLFVHPWLEKATHHTPVFELVILVAISSILAPLHHNLNHWIKNRLAKTIVKEPVTDDMNVEED